MLHVGNVLWNETNRIGLFSECNIFLKEYLKFHIIIINVLIENNEIKDMYVAYLNT